MNLLYIIKQRKNNKRMETLLGALIFGTTILVYGFLTFWAAYQNQEKK
jgi:preprotein translocase subunit YajC